MQTGLTRRGSNCYCSGLMGKTCFTLAVLLSFILGCASAPKPEEVEDRDLYGAAPAPSAFKSSVDGTIAGVLKDPDSRKVRFLQSAPSPMWISVHKGLGQVERYFGYGMLVGVNAKNSYGGYVGESLWLFHVESRGGQLRYWDDDAIRAHKGTNLNWGSPSWANAR